MKILLITLCLLIPLIAEEYTSNKTVTVISAKSTADGSTDMYSELLEECIEKLPKLATLVPTVHSKVQYLRSINGKQGHDDHVKMFSAELVITYIEGQKFLLVLTQKSIQAQEPKTETYNRRIQKKVRFISDSNNGSSYANQSKRVYYFDSAEGAKKDVIAQAQAWLSQNSAALCTQKMPQGPISQE